MASILSFDHCNEKLIERGILINILEYISLTNMVPYNISNDCNLCELNSLLYFMVDIAGMNLNEFNIPVNSLERIGFRIQDTFLNRLRQRLNQPVELLENDVSFLKKNGLKKGRDYIMHRMHLSATSEDMDIEYKISPNGLYRLISNKYGKSFLIALNARVFQITLHYNSYVDKYYHSRMRSLNNTIHGLSDDINQLVHEHPQLKKSKIIHNEYDCTCIDESFISNDSNDSYIRHSNADDGPWTPSDSPIDIIMDSNLSNDSDDVQIVSTPTSILGTNIDSNHVDILQKRFQTYLHNSFNESKPINNTTLSHVPNHNKTPWRRVWRHSAHQ